MADDRLDEVSCGAVAAHVSCPHLQPPRATAVGKKRREPMKGGIGQCDGNGIPRRQGQKTIQQRCKVARFGRAWAHPLGSFEVQSHHQTYA